MLMEPSVMPRLGWTEGGLFAIEIADEGPFSKIVIKTSWTEIRRVLRDTDETPLAGTKLVPETWKPALNHRLRTTTRPADNHFGQADDEDDALVPKGSQGGARSRLLDAPFVGTVSGADMGRDTCPNSWPPSCRTAEGPRVQARSTNAEEELRLRQNHNRVHSWYRLSLKAVWQ